MWLSRLERGNCRAIGLGVFIAAALLLASMGAAIWSAPITVPLILVVVGCHPSTTFTVVGALLAALTLGEFTWAVTYGVAGESEPWIVLLPVLGCAAGLATVAEISRRARRALGR